MGSGLVEWGNGRYLKGKRPFSLFLWRWMMAATEAMRLKLRRMVQEPTRRTYDDAALDGYIERWPVVDGAGERPFGDDGAANDNWAATYDLNAAAAEIWLEKAGAEAAAVDRQETGAKGALWRGESARHRQAMAMHRRYAARRAGRSVRVRSADEERR